MSKTTSQMVLASTDNSGRNSGKSVGRVGRVENLKPWPKGVSGNPGGRPKANALSHAYRNLLETTIPGDSQGRTFAEKIALVLARKALKGDVHAARELADRAEGKARQSVTLDHLSEDPLLSRSREELEYFAQTGLWPTESN